MKCNYDSKSTLAAWGLPLDFHPWEPYPRGTPGHDQWQQDIVKYQALQRRSKELFRNVDNQLRSGPIEVVK